MIIKQGYTCASRVTTTVWCKTMKVQNEQPTSNVMASAPNDVLFYMAEIRIGFLEGILSNSPKRIGI